MKKDFCYDDVSVFVRIQPKGDTMAHRYEIPLQRLIDGLMFQCCGENFEAEIFCKLTFLICAETAKQKNKESQE